MPKSSENISRIIAYSRNDFRNWLKINHKKENKVAVIVHKRHTGKNAPTHRELIEEAICYGWIDTTIKRIDHDTFLRHFSKRNAKSKWSDNTLKYAKELIREKKMTPEGLKFYKQGLARPTHDHGIPKNPDMPQELKKVLMEHKVAEKNFKKFAPSTKRMLYRWVLRAKLPETRYKRVKQIVQSAVEKNKNFMRPNQKANQ
ncbi:YdeI/OmpD-associated family protein [Candidatus Parcubacteria bacterium]|nr:YdeI/OmpD-associated family protein [Candidatus Parcubacteria bacterium]